MATLIWRDEDIGDIGHSFNCRTLWSNRFNAKSKGMNLVFYSQNWRFWSKQIEIFTIILSASRPSVERLPYICRFRLQIQQ